MQQGLSLIELLIVVAVTGILAAIAYPSYSDQLRRAARSEVVGLLHDAALRLERHRVRTGQYAEGDHVIFVGEVERCNHRAHASPLLFHGGRFYAEHPL